MRLPLVPRCNLRSNMKWLLAIAVSFLVVMTGKAQTLDAWGNQAGAYYLNGFTNAVPTAVVTNYTPVGVYHTYQLVGTNVFSYAIDRTLDRTNWYVGATNAVAIGTVAEATITGKYQHFRVRIQGTNVGATINYMGGQ